MLNLHCLDAGRTERKWFLRGVLMAFLGCALLAPAQAQLTQFGSKLVDAGNIGAAQQGFTVALSADGQTAIWGAYTDNGGVSGVGAAWVYILSGGVWTEQAKLVGIGGTAPSYQGYSVALSADGSTAIVGGPSDSGNVGAAWVYTRSAGVWTQQAKLTAGDAVGIARQGFSAALSSDGNTAAVGGINDSGDAGAVWMWVRSSGTWSEVAKLTASDRSGASLLGYSVALSGDGNTVIAGGPHDHSSKGAAWVFKRRGGTWAGDPAVYTPPANVWTQQGLKLTAADATANAQQGISVALASSGSTAIVGGMGDNANTGAAWIYTISPVSPSPLPPANAQVTIAAQGAKRVGTGGSASSQQGYSAALSADGNTALVGGPQNVVSTVTVGGAWVWKRAGSTWTQQGAGPLVGTGNTGNAFQGWKSVSLSSDGNTAIVGGYGDNSNQGAVWIFAAPGHPDLAISKTHTGTLSRGASAAYTLTVSNAGNLPTDGTQVSVVDVLPGGMTATAMGGGATWSCTLGTLTCTTSNVLNAGDKYADITLTVNVSSGAPSNLLNTATVSGGGDISPVNNTASDFVALPALPDLTLTKSHAGGFAPGQVGAAYSITVRNVGSGPTSGTVTVSDTLPGTLSSAIVPSTHGWTCSGGATVSCHRGDALAPGGNYPPIAFTVTVSGSASGTISNTATVSGGGEANTANDSSTDVATITTGANLSITNTHPGNFTHGQTDAWVLRVTNVGSQSTAGKVTVVDTIPAGVTIEGMSGTGWLCAPFLATCVRSDALAPGASYPGIRVAVQPASAGSVTNGASVSGGGGGGSSASNTATVL
jgi:uncharacterized repeat protein (TIGR01451 family)